MQPRSPLVYSGVASIYLHNEENPTALRSMGGFSCSLYSFTPLKVCQVVEGVPSVQIRSQRSEKYRQFL